MQSAEIVQDLQRLKVASSTERGEEEGKVRVLKSFYYSVHEYLSPTELERLSTWLLMKLRNKRLRVV